MALVTMIGAALEDAEAIGRRYRSAQPFPHVVIDKFLPEDAATSLADSFPHMEQMSKLFKEPMSFKGQTSDISNKAPAFSGIFSELQSDEFRAQVGRVTGIDKLLRDDILAGGGLHQSPNTGFLDLHVDANFHPVDKGLHRRVNLLIYLNRGWREEWGGNLELWSDRNKKPHECIHSIAPIFNRAVIFSTTRTSWHGVGPISCPNGETRKSLALYYYTTERPGAEIYKDSSVIWQNRSVAWKRAVYPVMNLAISILKPYAKHLRRKSTFDALPEQD